MFLIHTVASYEHTGDAQNAFEQHPVFKLTIELAAQARRRWEDRFARTRLSQYGRADDRDARSGSVGGRGLLPLLNHRRLCSHGCLTRDSTASPGRPARLRSCVGGRPS